MTTSPDKAPIATEPGNTTPDGRESPREALLRAATRLFSERGPAAVSTREIAAAAGVNSGLIHRHFRTKDALLHEVLHRLAREISSVEKDVAGSENLLRFFYATHERAEYWNLLARCILDGVPLETIQTEYPTIARMVALVTQLQGQGWGPKDADPRQLAALLGALALGWLVFEPWLLRASGLADEDPDATRSESLRTAIRLLGFEGRQDR